ncbi:MAG: amino acid kinase family protein [Candidatus Nitrosopumilus sp. bin_32a]
MTNLIVAKFGGSAIGPNGETIPKIIQRISNLKVNSKVIAVFSAPLTIHNEKKRSLTDIILEQGKNAENGIAPSLDIVKSTYQKILEMVDDKNKENCKKTIDFHLEKAQKALDEALKDKEFANETRSQALAFSGEILMSHVMNHILRSNNIISEAVEFENWPIITDNNIEFTNFLIGESREKIGKTAELLEKNEVVAIGGFIGKTVDGITTTYERGGSDRTAADLGILFHKKYETSIDFEKDSAVVSADPKIVDSELREIIQLSYNEARLAGMFGMKILDPIAIKEIVENGVDMPITITNMKNPEKITTIKRSLEEQKGHPIKIVTGKENCAIFRIETSCIQKLLTSLEKDKHYSEFVILSPFTKDGLEFSRILFLDGEYVKRNEKYLLGFDSLATITYNRGVITLIGDEMWRVQQVVSRTSAKIGESGLNILNIDAQEETSRIIIVIEDSDNNITKAIKTIHQEISKINFI